MHSTQTFFSAYLKGPAKGRIEGPGRVQEARVVCAGWFFFFASYIYSKDSLNESVSFTTEVLASFKSYVSFKKIILKKHFQPCPAKEALSTCPINLPSHQETLELNRNKSFST